MFEQRYYRGLVDVASQPVERKAVASTSGATSAMGKYMGRKTIADYGRGTQRLQARLNLDEQKRDIKAATKDAGIATAVGVGNVGLTAASVYQRMLDEAENERLANKQEEYYGAIKGLLSENREFYEDILRNGVRSPARPEGEPSRLIMEDRL